MFLAKREVTITEAALLLLPSSLKAIIRGFLWLQGVVCTTLAFEARAVPA